jgi:deoxyribonuclease-4
VEWGVDRVARGAAKALDQALERAPDSCSLWLENTAGGGGQMGGTLSQLRLLLDRLPGLPVGVCLDTAHAWGAGYHLDRPDGVSRFLDRVDQLIGLRRVHLWHFNDSDRKRGSKADRHTHLGRGLMGARGLGALVRDPRLAQASFIMETPKNSRWADRRNLAYFLRLRDGARRPIS